MNTNRTLTLEEGGEWQEELDFKQQVTLGATERVFHLLNEFSEQLNIGADITEGKVNLRIKARGKKTTEKLVYIEPFAFARYFLGKWNLSDEFTDKAVSEVEIRNAVADWLDLVIAAIARKLENNKKEKCFTEAEIIVFESVLKFLNYHRFTRFTKEQ